MDTIHLSQTLCVFIATQPSADERKVESLRAKEKTYQVRKSTLEKRHITPVEQLNNHGFGDFELVLLEVVEHVFRIEGIV